VLVGVLVDERELVEVEVVVDVPLLEELKVVDRVAVAVAD